jgi:hypothetical protein
MHLAGIGEKFGIPRTQAGRKTNSPAEPRDKSILSLGLEHLYFPQFACWQNHFPIFGRRILERVIA